MTTPASTTMLFGRPFGIVRLLDGRITQRLDLRALVITLALVTMALAVSLFALASGEFAVPVGEVIGALFGRASPKVHMVVVEWRLPRAALALLLGAALGVSGAIFQSLTRNPLGSPDIIGFNAGSYTGALIVITLLGGSFYAVAGGALVGGLLTAIVVYGLSWRSGVQGFRLIVVGIGVSAMLTSLNTWLMLRADLKVAMMASIWGSGSLNGLGLDRLLQASIVLALVMPFVLLLSRPMRQLELGDDAARAHGVSVERTRLGLMMVGVALTAIATGIAGPIAFVALAAPQIARRLAGSAGVALLPAAAMGALLLAASDVLAQRAFAPSQLPVGIVTVCLGGLYFAWLLMREARRQP